MTPRAASVSSTWRWGFVPGPAVESHGRRETSWVPPPSRRPGLLVSSTHLTVIQEDNEHLLLGTRRTPALPGHSLDDRLLHVAPPCEQPSPKETQAKFWQLFFSILLMELYSNLRRKGASGGLRGASISLTAEMDHMGGSVIIRKCLIVKPFVISLCQ